MEPEFPGLDFDCEVADGRDDFGDYDGDGDHNNSNQPLSATTCVCILLIIIRFTRSYATLRAADLDWIVGPGYSLGWYILENNHEKQTLNHEKQTLNHEKP